MTAANAAMPAPSGSTDSEIPIATPCRGVQPPSQYAYGWWAVWKTSSTHIAATAAAVTMPRPSCSTRGSTGPVAISSAATTNGRATGRAVMCVTVVRPSVAKRAQVRRTDAAEPLVSLHDEGEQQRRDRRLDHHVGQHQNLHDGVDELRARWDVGDDRRLAAGAVPDAEQHEV